MKRALQAILMAPIPVERLAIMMGRKRITIREGHRDYTLGPVMICCHIVPWTVMTSITEVRLTTLEGVTDAELTADGYIDHQDMLNKLKEFYPNLKMDSEMTVVRWGELDRNNYFSNEKNLKRYVKDNDLKEMYWLMSG